MDGRNVESRARLYKDQSRLQTLLCRNIRGTFPLSEHVGKLNRAKMELVLSGIDIVLGR